MSTLGKVLAVLATLSLLGWIFLASLVTQHHMNWSKRLNEAKAEVASLAAELPPLDEQIYANMKAATLAQDSLERTRTNFRAELAMAQKTESDTKEAQERYRLQLLLAEQEVVAAKNRHEIRRKERLDFDAKIKQEEAGVQALKAENEKLRGELKALQDSFISTLAENKSYADRLPKSTPTSAKPRVRLGSMVR